MKTIVFTFDQPFLQKTADLILDIYSGNNYFDLSELTIILSSKRSQRRLLEILSEKCTNKNILLSPPIFLTPKSFCKVFAEQFVNIPLASTIEQTIAWVNAAGKCEEAINSILVKNNKSPQERDFFRVAQLIMPLHKTLSGENLSIDQISKSSLIEDFEEEKKRWSAIAEIEKEYHNELESNNLIDPYKAILKAVNTAETNPKPIFNNLFVVNVVDSFNLFGKALKTQNENMTIISYGDKEYFDDLGFLKTKNPKLENDFINFQINSIRFLNSPNEQADEILNIIGDHTENRGYGDFVISAPDSQTHRPMVQVLESASINCHNAAGISFKETEIGCLLSSLANCLEKDGCEIESFFEFINHPLIENLIIRNFKINSIELYNKLSNKIFRKVCKHKIEIIEEKTFHFFSDEKYPLVKQIPEFIFKEIISPLSAKAKIIDWPTKINTVFKKIFSAQFVLPNNINISVHQDALDKWMQLSDEIVSSRIPWKENCDAKTSILRFLSLLKNTALIPKSTGPVIDITGWLEIALDDSPIIIVAGFNEGIVPEKFSADPFLPNSLREKLNLPNYNSRFLRDKYLTKCITEKTGNSYFIAGRRSAENDPLKPGKILFCQDFENQAKILKQFYAPEKNEQKNNELGTQSIKNAECNQHFGSINTLQQTTPLELPKEFKLNIDFLNSLSVSAINDYLTCPFKFYLKRIQKIYAPDVFSNELEGVDIGNIIHHIIYKNIEFIHSEENDDTTAQVLIEDLNNILIELYGEPLNPIIQIQRENLVRRLEAFVPAFREIFNGWEIMKNRENTKMAEYTIFPELEIAGEKVKIKGVVDLIEKNNENIFRIIDFKTGSKAKRKNDVFASKKEQWKDIQLILYALWFSQKYGFEPEIAFFNIPPDAEKIKYETIEFEDEEIEAAISFVKDVLKEIINEKIPLEVKFCKTDTTANCKYCDYKQICER
ncbi:PD-(D/E)XK nuclease family protein [bacterium]|nr:PD-(D/E)XK nuclease family protein [bacterium]